MWLFQKKKFDPSLDEIRENGWYGFVYLITSGIDNRMYIGKKFFYSKITRPPLKGKKCKRHELKESNWRDYWSSSKIVNSLVEEHGKENFTREIISLHPNKQETNYHELRAQILFDVLDSRNKNGERLFLNENIERKYYPSEKFRDERCNLFEDYIARIIN